MFKKIKRWFNRPNNPAGNVYYAKLRTLQGTFYKIGFTSKSTLIERLAFGGYGDEKLIEHEFFFSYRVDAWDVEQTLLEYFDNYRAFGKFSKDPMSPLCGRGQTELFTFDILGLDDRLYTQAEKESGEAAEVQKSQSGEGCLMILIGLILVPFTLGFSLFFIFGGLAGIFESTKSGALELSSPQRPVHPAMIEILINELRMQSVKNNDS